VENPSSGLACWLRFSLDVSVLKENSLRRSRHNITINQSTFTLIKVKAQRQTIPRFVLIDPDVLIAIG